LLIGAWDCPPRHRECGHGSTGTCRVQTAGAEEVTYARPDLENYVVNSRLTRPSSNFPVGKYRVEIKHGDKLATTARVTIQ
jgi:hypothetical protein